LRHTRLSSATDLVAIRLKAVSNDDSYNCSLMVLVF
jgi:hypothetical protein